MGLRIDRYVLAMHAPLADIELCRASHDRLRTAVAAFDAADLSRPSLLPGWTVAHLLTHIARNADSVVRRLDGARVGVVADQYEGGAAGRAAEIATGARRPATEIVDDVVSSAAALEAAFATFPSDHWDRLGRTVYGDELPVATLPFHRMREVEVHLVDLGLGYTPDQWPHELATRWLPEMLSGLPGRSDPTTLLAWTLRRGPAPELAAF
jgi:maleylpyruvate isomerase